ncbi:MAG: YobA family protein [Oscillospiraceae bacterium]|nr:YobA family protein [Oscillospiraceae bacterium]
MQMIATVIAVNPRSLTVRNEESGETVIVNLNNPRRFNVGNRVRITYNGIMTMSMPPQITAINIQPLPVPPSRPTFPGSPPIFPVIPPAFPITPPFAPPPRQMRVRVVRREHGFLIVQNTANNQILRADTPNARFFCPGNLAVIRFNQIIPALPPRIDLIDINPVC